MSAKAAKFAPSPPVRRQRLERTLTLWAGSVVVALGLGLVLAGASASDVVGLSEALGTPVETTPLPRAG